MSNKYIASVGKEKQLRGPVEMEKPSCYYLSTYTDSGCPECIAYESHIASLPIAFTNVSWLKESDNGKILELNVHFLSKECDKDRKCTNDNILSCHDKGCQKPIAVPIKDKQPESDLDKQLIELGYNPKEVESRGLELVRRLKTKSQLALKEGSPYHETSDARIISFTHGWEACEKYFEEHYKLLNKIK